MFLLPGTDEGALKMPRTCVGCGTVVSRRDSHRNRYGEYVCRSCEASGIKFSTYQRVRRWLKRTAPRGLLWIGVLILALIVMATLFRYFTEYNPPTVDPGAGL
jgi:hypothetical protein